MNADKLKSLQIAPEQKQRTSRPIWAIFLGIMAMTAIAAYFAWGRPEDQRRIKITEVKPPILIASQPGIPLQAPPQPQSLCRTAVA